FTSLGALKTGMDILLKQEDVQVNQIMGHGGLFKTPKVGQHVLAAAMNAPVSVMETAGEGGAWGIALLASYMVHKVFVNNQGLKIEPDSKDVEGFELFMKRYAQGLPIERAAVEHMEL
ncbi:MAG: FGGY-family carbohydrate kinase, partial [Lachnospiraceae bacterium]